MKKQLVNLSALSIAALVLGLFACSPKVDSGGYVRKDDPAQVIKPGMSKDEVVGRLGSPSSQSSFGPETWYYITSRKEAYGPMAYDVAQQDVACIAFDAGGLVTKVEAYDLASSEDVDVVDRQTPTEGHSLGFFEQILGNIGRFNNPNGQQPGNNRNGPPPGR